jgi:protein-disulfide isomerase
MTRRTILIAIGLLLFIALGTTSYLLLTREAPDTTALATAPFVITDYDRTLGSPKASIVMIEYAAPMCPICANFNAREFPRLKSEYIDTGKVFYVFRVFPIGAPDYPAEGLARCLPKSQYFPFIDFLYRNQDKWDPDGHEIPDVRAALQHMGQIAGLSAADANRCMDDSTTRDHITQSRQDAVARYGVSGTPSFVVGGQVVYSGEYPWDEMKAMLDARLANGAGPAQH